MMRVDELEHLLATRRSVRRFTAQVPPREVLERLLQLAVLAPSASNKQPWRFLVVCSRSVIDEMAAMVRRCVLEVEQHISGESAASFRAYGEYFTRFVEAPVVMVPIFRGPPILSQLVDAALSQDAAERVAQMERDSALVGTSLAVGNLLLAAHAQGLGASAMTGPLLASHLLKALLGVPPGWGIAAVVALGYPAELPPPTERKSVEKVTRWIE